MNDSPLFVASSIIGGRRVPQVMQTENAECGLACMAMIASYHGFEIDLPGLRRRFPTSLSGLTMNRMIEIAHELGFDGRGLRVSIESLDQLSLPCVLHWNLNHFVVLKKISKKWVEVNDPSFGPRRLSIAEFGKHFTGVVLELKKTASFRPEKVAQKIRLRSLTGHITGLPGVFAQVLGLAIAIELLALIIPFQMQWVIDNVLSTGDNNLLIILGTTFFIVIALQAGLAIARGWLISWFGGTMNIQWTNNLFGHLLQLPLDFFEKRKMGDVMSRFNSIRSIQNTLTGSFVETLLDGFMSAFALAILFFYSPGMTCVVFLFFSMYAILRAMTFYRLRRINEEQLIYRARQDTELMESIRGVRTIKLANKQSDRRASLANATIESAKRDIQQQRQTMTFGAINQGMLGMQRSLLITLGAWMCLKETFSTGMVLAFVAFSDQFCTRITSAIDKFIDFRMLRLHAERLADIALSETELYQHGSYTGVQPTPWIALHNVSFRYADNEPYILHNINLRIEQGESVALVGASGCGKTTLSKIILGLLQPTEGYVEIGGIDIRKFGLNRYRTMLAAVMQDDVLFAGSVADNISFFDQEATAEAIHHAARQAAIHDEILGLTMGYESLVGDMGSSLSGGQKQRVLLARALFRSPKILILDEATSHLDVDNERLINVSIRELKMTRILIAHRPETIASASRIIHLANGRILCKLNQY